MKTIVFITRMRALYGGRRGRIQLMEYGIIGTAKQIVNGTAQLICNRNNGFHPGKVAARLHRRQSILVQLAGYKDVFDEEPLVVSGFFDTFSNLGRSEQ